MKKLVSSLLVLTVMLAMGQAAARNVSEQMAKEAAAHFLSSNTDLGTVEADNLTLVFTVDNPDLGIAASYAFEYIRGGWIIMSGSTLTDAVIGYSEQGNLNGGNLPTPALELVKDYSKYVSAVQNADQEGKYDDSDEWDILLNKRAMPSAKASNVILMETTWDQNGDMWGFANGTTYDMYTPLCQNDYGQMKHAPVGCVATALAQIIRYYEFPYKAKGNTKSYTVTAPYYPATYTFKFNDSAAFDYSLMPNKIESSTPDAQRREISRLCKMVGLAVNMGYSADASGASSGKVPGAMVAYFKYKRGQMIYRRASLTDEVRQQYISNYGYDPMNYEPWSTSVGDSTFLSELRSDLMLNRPVYMGGSSSTGDGRDAGGHAWVCNGYNTENEGRYYMNWGWGSIGDGWYLLRANTQQGMYISGTGYCFNIMQECIVGLIPPQDSTDRDIYVGITPAEETTVLLEAYPNPATYSVVLPYGISADADLNIYSMDGRLVETRRLSAANNRTEVRVDAMPAGIYIYRVNGATGKFVVQ